jgi:hypothetical protein
MDVTVTIVPTPTLGGGATLGDLRGMCNGQPGATVAHLVEAWITDQVVAGETDPERLAACVVPILEPHGLEIAIRIVP